MTHVATIHSTVVDEMAEILAAARTFGAIEVRHTDGGLEVHRLDDEPIEYEFTFNSPTYGVIDPDSDDPIIAAKSKPTPDDRVRRPKRAPSERPQKKAAPKRPADVRLAHQPASLTCPECRFKGNTPAGLAVHRARKHGVAGATRRSFDAEPIAKTKVDHDRIRAAAADAAFDEGGSFDIKARKVPVIA